MSSWLPTNGIERNRMCARRWLNFMRLGGVRERNGLLKDFTGRYWRAEGRVVRVYLPVGVPL